jgi:hypothetical protein
MLKVNPAVPTRPSSGVSGVAVNAPSLRTKLHPSGFEVATRRATIF